METLEAIDNNPATLVKKPKVVKAEVKPLTAAQAQALLAAAKGRAAVRTLGSRAVVRGGHGELFG